MQEKYNEFINSRIGKHVISFSRTYITILIGIYIFGYDNGENIHNMQFLLDAAEASLVALLRNAYKFMIANE